MNAVNTVGVMGKGIAPAFKQRCELNDRLYAAACRAGEVRVGHLFVTETGEPAGPRWIVNFPTRQHGRQPSQWVWLAAGLADLQRVIGRQGVRSLAIPALGAGLGGLAWPDVRAAIEACLADLHEVQIDVYEHLAG